MTKPWMESTKQSKHANQQCDRWARPSRHGGYGDIQIEGRKF